MYYVGQLHHQRHSLQWQPHPGESHSHQQNSTNFHKVHSLRFNNCCMKIHLYLNYYALLQSDL